MYHDTDREERSSMIEMTEAEYDSLGEMTEAEYGVLGEAAEAEYATSWMRTSPRRWKRIMRERRLSFRKYRT